MFVVSTLPETLISKQQADLSANDNCTRCHGLSTLSVRDSLTGGIRNYSVDKNEYAHSIHGALECSSCHENGYGAWPHSSDEYPEKELRCTSCHQDPEMNLKALFGDIHSEFKSSVHASKLGDQFSCFSCHDPHSFRRIQDVTSKKIDAANGMCLNCHESEEQFTRITDRNFPVLEVTHAWLPNQKLHWEQIRCVDCHSSYNEPNVSHNILPKSQALKSCESCHTKSSALMSKLYKYEHRESRQRMGFVNGRLLNDAYVIGSTRNPMLDSLSLLAFGMTVLGVAGHGYLRFRSKKKRAKVTEDKE
jgi:NAD-dependent SIR2 family protein deacetylase